MKPSLPIARFHLRRAFRHLGQALRAATLGPPPARPAAALHPEPLDDRRVRHPSELCTHDDHDCPPSCPWRQVQCQSCQGSGLCPRCQGDGCDPDKGEEIRRLEELENRQREDVALGEIGAGGASC